MTTLALRARAMVRIALPAAALLGASACGAGTGPDAAAAERPPIPVEVAPVERGPLRLVRTVTGSLESSSQFVVAAKVGGRLERLEVDLGDAVARGQVVAHFDDDEFAQAVLEAEADLAVARAGLTEAQSALEIAERALAREESLRQEGVTSESSLDAARADVIAGRAHVEVTRAQLARAEASLETARIRLGYARVSADWSGGGERRRVAERFAEPGTTVPANTPLLSIVELDPILAVVYVAERDYGLLSVGQAARIVTDAVPGRTFTGSVLRIAPIFRRSTRQARVEIELANPLEELKPGMFVRASLELARAEDAVHVPLDALTERAGATGVFVLAADGATVRWQAVAPGIRDGARVQVQDGLAGRVVVLGQALCDDGASVRVVER
jgi:RND family efflux transporter MFP subunit